MRKLTCFIFLIVLSVHHIAFAGTGARKHSPAPTAVKTDAQPQAQAPSQPQAFVENLGQAAIETLAQKDLPQSERNHKFRVLLNQNFDVPALGRFALGRYWRTATTEQQQEYLQLFEDVVVGTYSARFAKYSGQTIQVTGSKKEFDSVSVQSRLINPDGSEPVMIDWRLKQDGNNFKIIDVIVEGVSMSTTQRSEYASVIERNGGDVESLLKILRNKSKAAAAAGSVANGQN